MDIYYKDIPFKDLESTYVKCDVVRIKDIALGRAK
jgi:hypothetical protein